MNKRKHLHRKDIKGPDAFQTTVGRILSESGPYLRLATIALAAVLVLGMIVWTVRYNQRAAVEQVNAELRDLASSYEDNLQKSLAGEEADWKEVISGFESLYQKTDDIKVRQIITAYVANSYIAAGEYDAAIGAAQDLEQLAADRPEMAAFALYLRGKAYELRGQIAEAQEAYQSAAQLSPNPLGEFLEAEFKRASAPRVPPQIAARYLAEPEKTDSDAK